MNTPSDTPPTPDTTTQAADTDTATPSGDRAVFVHHMGRPPLDDADLRAFMLSIPEAD